MQLDRLDSAEEKYVAAQACGSKTVAGVAYAQNPTDRIDSSTYLKCPRKEWSWREESNLQPAVYKTAALPIELRQPAHKIAFELRLAQYQ